MMRTALSRRATSSGSSFRWVTAGRYAPDPIQNKQAVQTSMSSHCIGRFATGRAQDMSTFLPASGTTSSRIRDDIDHGRIHDSVLHAEPMLALAYDYIDEDDDDDDESSSRDTTLEYTSMTTSGGTRPPASDGSSNTPYPVPSVQETGGKSMSSSRKSSGGGSGRYVLTDTVSEQEYCAVYCLWIRTLMDLTLLPHTHTHLSHTHPESLL
jgi:hypothetical protein